MRLPSVLVVLCVSALLPYVAAHQGSQLHPHLDMTLDVPGGIKDGATGMLSATWQGQLIVAEDDSGVYLRYPAPTGASVGWVEYHGTADGDLPGNGIPGVVTDEDGHPWLEWRWSDGAPEPGTSFERARIVYHFGITFDPDASVSWTTLSEDTSVAIDVPRGIKVFSDRGLTGPQATHDGNMERYTTIALFDTALHIDLRAAAEGVDPGRAHPAWSGWGWVIVIGASLASGAIWWAGHRADERRAREHER